MVSQETTATAYYPTIRPPGPLAAWPTARSDFSVPLAFISGFPSASSALCLLFQIQRKRIPVHLYVLNFKILHPHDFERFICKLHIDILQCRVANFRLARVAPEYAECAI